MWKKNRKGERNSSKFMYFHEKELARMLNDTRVKIRERKRNNVQILRDGSRLILDEITKSVGLSRRTEIYGVNFVDSPVETVLILHLHMYLPVYHFSSSRFALGNKLSKIHICLFQYTDKLFTYVFYIITWRRIENVTFETCYYSIEIIFFDNIFFFFYKIALSN